MSLFSILFISLFPPPPPPLPSPQQQRSKEGSARVLWTYPIHHNKTKKTSAFDAWFHSLLCLCAYGICFFVVVFVCWREHNKKILHRFAFGTTMVIILTFYQFIAEPGYIQWFSGLWGIKHQKDPFKATHSLAQCLCVRRPKAMRIYLYGSHFPFSLFLPCYTLLFSFRFTCFYLFIYYFDGDSTGAGLEIPCE